MPAIDGSRVLVAGGAHRVGRALALDLAEARRGRLRELPQLGRPGREDAGRHRGARPPLGGRAGRRVRPGRHGGDGRRRRRRPRRARRLRPLPLGRLRAARRRRTSTRRSGTRRWTRRPRASCSRRRRRSGVMAPAGGGVIVAITDVAGLQPWPRFAPHAAAKAAQIHLVKCLAAAWGRDGIRVCGVAPGPVLMPEGDRREPRRDGARPARRPGRRRARRSGSASNPTS